MPMASFDITGSQDVERFAEKRPQLFSLHACRPGVEPDVAAPAPTPAAFSALRNDVTQALFRTAIATEFRDSRNSLLRHAERRWTTDWDVAALSPLSRHPLFVLGTFGLRCENIGHLFESVMTVKYSTRGRPHEVY